MKRTRILVVDDARLMRRRVRDILIQNPLFEVVGGAPNGKNILEKVAQVKPDIITIGIEIPVMNALDSLSALRQDLRELPVIIYSTLTEEGAAATMEALALGARDYVSKPKNLEDSETERRNFSKALVEKVSYWSSGQEKNQVPQQAGEERAMAAEHRIDLLAIGCSTGGPEALNTLFEALPPDLPVPLLIVQHMPPVFTKLLAERLNRCNGPKAVEAQEGESIQRGGAWIAPGGKHMMLERGAIGPVIHLHEGPLENSCRPAVDVLFRSLAPIYGKRVLAVVLTGMGQDGLCACEGLAEIGAPVFVQDKASAVVWGMPGVIAKAGLATKILPLNGMASAITARLRVGR